MLEDEERDRLPRRADADLVGDRAVGGLRAADGLRPRAPRPHEPGDPRRNLDRLPPAGAAPVRAARGLRPTTRGQGNPGEVWEEVEFWIALTWKHGSRRELAAFASTTSPRSNPGDSRSVSTNTTADIFEHSGPRACPRPRRSRGTGPSGIHETLWGLQRALRRSGSATTPRGTCCSMTDRNVGGSRPAAASSSFSVRPCRNGVSTTTRPSRLHPRATSTTRKLDMQGGRAKWCCYPTSVCRP